MEDEKKIFKTCSLRIKEKPSQNNNNKKKKEKHAHQNFVFGFKKTMPFFFSDTKLKCFPKIDSSKTSHREHSKHEHSTKRKSFFRQTQTFENVHTKL